MWLKESFFVFLVFFECILVSCSQNKHYTEDGLPVLFEKDDFYKCRDESGTYCKTSFYLTVYNDSSKLAVEIKKSANDSSRFRRSSLHRMICIPKEVNVKNTKEAKAYIAYTMEEKLKDYNVTLEVEKLECDTEKNFIMLDLFLIIAILLLIYMVLESTRKDDKNASNSASAEDTWTKIFSLKENWKRIAEKNNNPDFQRLKSIQGLRFFNTIFVIIFHTHLCHLLLFIENPKDYEENIAANPVLTFMYQSSVFIVQTFFMTSNFLITNQILELYKKNGRYTFGDMIILFVNRIIRLLPTLLTMVMMIFVGIKLFPNGTPIVDVINMSWNGCQNSWWATIFQLNFLYKSTQMCNPGSWYLSVDTLLYVTTIVVLYIYLNFQITLKKLLVFLFLFLNLCYGIMIFAYNVDAMYKINTESIRGLLDSPAFYYLYINPLASWSTSIVGIALGYIYFKIKNKEIKMNTVQRMLWLAVVIVLPTAAILLTIADVNGLNRAILGPFIKPLSALGYGIGVLGFSKGYGGLIKKVLEWDFAVKMSNFTYCTYVYHFFLVFLLHGARRTLYRYSFFALVSSYIIDVVLSYAFGMLTTLMIEYPGLRLQKLYIPQIKKTVLREKKSDNKIK
ncbi:O-acyltransferase like protein-like [Sitophilus oryzae]|uniref:O-acyltransferase like protein-like n=1 Tax=Sitophilus oryzae TaxID=7048 RepID=A0A6J2X7L1_SITOR|nr:O-acyltransferase like protein-like [Sitophilus oryzae]